MLEVLAGTESGLGISQIAKLAPRGTRQGLVLATDRLVAHGLVHAQPANRGYLYQLNREHVLAEAVTSASRARSTIMARLTEAADGLNPRPGHVSVFGSFARREAGPDSDVDLLVVLEEGVPGGERWDAQLRALADRVMAWTGNRMQYLVFSHDEFRAVVDRGEPIVDSWVTDSVTVLGSAVETLVRAGDTERRR